MKKIFSISLIIIGFTSMATQIVLMRELLSIFYGNEMTIGLALFAWLFWVGFGSWMVGRLLAERIREAPLIFSICLVIFAFSLPFTCIFIRAIPSFFNLIPGQIIGPSVIFSLSLLSLFLVCTIGGFLFILGCRLFASQIEEKQTAIGKAYILEAIGAAIGGLAISFILIQRFFPLQIIFLLSVINLFLAFLVGFKYRPQAITTLFFLFVFCFIFLFKVPLLRGYSLKLRWPNQNLIYSTDTIYSNITVTGYENIRSFYINGLLSFSSHDRLTAEKVVHFPMLEHPLPKKILLIGGGATVLNEVLKYDIERVDYVELDPKIIELILKFADQEKVLKRRKVRLITNIDGRLFIKRTTSVYDVVILNLPEPHTTLLNRFYTVEFFKEAKHILTDNGILSFNLSSNPNYISQEQKNLYLSLQKSLEEVFEEVLITPGSSNFFLACKKKGILTFDWQKLISRLKERKIKSLYFREYYLFSELSPERIESFVNLLRTEKKIILNLDFRPIGYFYDIILYSSFFKYNLSLFLKKISQIKILALFLLIYVCLISIPFVKKINTRNFGILTCVATTGFSEMLFQIVILFSFQVIYGYVFYKLSIIFTFFMIGLIAGSCLITPLIRKNKVNMPAFIKTQISVCLYPLLLPLIFLFFKDNKSYSIFFIGSNIVFPVLPFIAGFIGGFQFPLANELYLKEKGTLTRTVAITYGLDLLGASIAAALVAVILIPILGVLETCLLAAVLNTAGLILITRK
jgi:spermidine synthase